jgi:hypothetical protein
MTPGPEDEVSQAEKRHIIREQATTMHQFGQSQADEINQGRFAAIGTPNVTGTTAIPSYPAASSSWQIQLPDEPPLGFENLALEEPSAASMLYAEQLGEPASDAAPSVDLADVERAGVGSPPSSPQERNDG